MFLKLMTGLRPPLDSDSVTPVRDFGKIGSHYWNTTFMWDLIPLVPL